jgi:hypothetical protein
MIREGAEQEEEDGPVPRLGGSESKNPFLSLEREVKEQTRGGSLWQNIATRLSEALREFEETGTSSRNSVRKVPKEPVGYR